MDPRHLEHSHHPAEIAHRLAEGPKASYLRDWVYGGIDGTVTTFAVVAGVVGADLSTKALLILGAANLFADGFSMAAANYSGSKAEAEEYEHVRLMEVRHVEQAPEGEREEIRQIFRGKGFEGEALDAAVKVITAKRERWIETMMTEEHGLPPINRSSARAAFTTFLAFVVCGSVPLFPFVLGTPASITVSTAMTGLTFFLIGSMRSRWSPMPWWRAGIETFTIGIVAAAMAYLVGVVLGSALDGHSRTELHNRHGGGISPRRQGDARPGARAACCPARQMSAGVARTSQPRILRSQIEVGTKVCRSIQEARADLIRLRSTVGGIAGEFGLAPIAASTHPFAQWSASFTPTRSATTCSPRICSEWCGGCHLGVHVHVGIDDDELRIDLLGQAAYFLPHLLALSTSSPFWQGNVTGLKSYRLSVFDELPRTGLPHQFSSYSEYLRTVELLVSAGLIEDATKLWWDLRLSARFPTLEMRITDVCPLIEDGIAIAALYVCIIRMLYRLRRDNKRWRYYPPFLVRENRWRAQRYGTTEGLVDFGEGALVPFPTLLEELFDLVAEDAAYFGCAKEIADARTIVRRGTSADRQLARFDQVKELGGTEQAALVAVVDDLIAETKTLPKP